MITSKLDRRTFATEISSSLHILASQEIWPSLENEMDTYEKRGYKYEGIEEWSKTQRTTSGCSTTDFLGIVTRHHPSHANGRSGDTHLSP